MEEDEDIREEEEAQEGFLQGPGRIIIGLFLLLILIMMSVPFYGIRSNPEPKNIPGLGEIFPDGIDAEYGNVTTPDSQADYYSLIEPSDPYVKYASDRVATEGCRSYSRVCYAKAIFYFVRDEFQYVNDPTHQEYVKTARQSLMSKGGDCDDASILLATMLRAVGIDTRLIFAPRHVYVQAMLPEAISSYKSDGDWVNLDPTCEYCGFGDIPAFSTG